MSVVVVVMVTVVVIWLCGIAEFNWHYFLHPSLPLQLRLASPYDKTFNGNNLPSFVRSQHRASAQIRMDGWMDG